MQRYSIAGLIAFAVSASALAQDVASEHPRADLRVHRSDVHDLAFSPDGKMLASTAAEGDIRLWDLEQGKVIREFRPRGRSGKASNFDNTNQRWIESIAFHPGGQKIAEATVESDRSNVVRVWDTEATDKAITLDNEAAGVRSVAFSPDGKLLAYNIRSGERSIHHIILRDVETGKVAVDLQDDRLAATVLAFSPDNKLLATAGGTKLLVWDLTTKKVVYDIKGYSKAITALAFSPDGTILAATGLEDMVRLWRMDDGKRIREFATEQEGVNAVGFSTSGRTVATAGNDRSIKLWNVENGRRQKTLVSHAGKALALAFSPDGKTLATGGKEGVICLWNMNEAAQKDQKDEPKSEKEKKEEERRKKEKEKEKEKEKKPRRP